jgi:hypothetical protein
MKPLHEEFIGPPREAVVDLLLDKNGRLRRRVLQLMIGTEKSEARARFISKNTYVLANAAQTFGDFGQHTDGTNVDSGVAFAALTVCLELAAALEREQPKK